MITKSQLVDHVLYGITPTEDISIEKVDIDHIFRRFTVNWKSKGASGMSFLNCRDPRPMIELQHRLIGSAKAEDIRWI